MEEWDRQIDVNSKGVLYGQDGNSDQSSAKFVEEFYKIAIPADSVAVARAVVYATEQPADVEIAEVVLRPTVRDF